MTGRDVLAMQLAGSFNMLRERLDMLSEQEWTARAIPGTNLPGFTLWHALRTIDWGVHCAIQGVPEVADRPEWRNLHASEFVYGAGITSQEADKVAHLVSRDQVRDYLGAVQPAALDWLKQQSDGDLDRVPDFEAHQRVKPRYLTPPVWAEVSDFVGKPTWQILARPCISHIRVHAGEVDIQRQASRVGNASAKS
ncbi:MAG: DinB family protein [Chloroflexi bacterium]|nr:MAG: DinB family protein [Chloroflexota bacterium]